MESNYCHCAESVCRSEERLENINCAIFSCKLVSYCNHKRGCSVYFSFYRLIAPGGIILWFLILKNLHKIRKECHMLMNGREIQQLDPSFLIRQRDSINSCGKA